MNFKKKEKKLKPVDLFAIAGLVSIIGSKLQAVATAYVVVTKSSLFDYALALVIAAIPAFVASPLSGILCERINPKKLFIIANMFTILLCFDIVLVYYTGVVYYYYIASFIFSFIFPVLSLSRTVVIRQSENKDNVISSLAKVEIYSTLGAAFTLIIAGKMIEMFGVVPVSVINSLTYVFSIVIAFFIKYDFKIENHKEQKQNTIFRKFKTQLEEYKTVLKDSKYRINFYYGFFYQLVGLLTNFIPAFVSLYLFDLGAKGIGYITFATTFGMVVSSFILKKYGNRIKGNDFLYFLFFGWLIAVCLVFMMYAGDIFTWMIICFVFSFADSFIYFYAVSINIANSSNKDVPKVAAMNQLIFNLTVIISSPLTAYLIMEYDFSVYVVISAVIILIPNIIYIFNRRKINLTKEETVENEDENNTKLIDMIVNEYLQIKPIDRVLITGEDTNEEFICELVKKILKTGAFVYTEVENSKVNEVMFRYSDISQIQYYPKYLNNKYEDFTKTINIINDKKSLSYVEIEDKVCAYFGSRAYSVKRFSEKIKEGEMKNISVMCSTVKYSDGIRLSYYDYPGMLESYYEFKARDITKKMEKVKDYNNKLIEQLEMTKEIRINGENGTKLKLEVLNTKWKISDGDVDANYRIYAGIETKKAEGIIVAEGNAYFNGSKLSYLEIRIKDGLIEYIKASANEESCEKNNEADKSSTSTVIECQLNNTIFDLISHDLSKHGTKLQANSSVSSKNGIPWEIVEVGFGTDLKTKEYSINPLFNRRIAGVFSLVLKNAKNNNIVILFDTKKDAQIYLDDDFFCL